MPDDPQLSELKLPPHSVEAEQSVLGGLMLDNEAADRIGDVIGAEDFYADAHRLIYAAATRLIADGRPADVVTVSEALDSIQKLDYVGGLDYLGALVANVPTAANIRHYATIVRERSILRQLASTAGEIADAAYHPLGRSAREVLDVAEAKVLHIAEQGTRGQRQYVEIATLLSAVVERIEDLYSRDDPSDVTGLATGYADLDRMTAGLQAGDLVIVAGRPSMGKAQPLDAKVLGRHGWKPMGSLQVGDALASVDGAPSMVTGVYPQGEREIFRVGFSDGRSTEVCAEHLWRVHHRDWPVPRTLSTAQVGTLLTRVRYRQRLWIDGPSGQWGHDEPLPVDPWIVGALLGDSATPAFMSIAGATLSRLGIRLPDELAHSHAGLPPRRIVQRSSNQQAGVRGASPDPLSVSLARLGLIGRPGYEKFIPRCYMNANARVRLDVLRGLLDKDGRVERSGTVRYPTCSRHLAEDVTELARSLGAWASLREKRGTGRPTFVVTIKHHAPRSLFLLSDQMLRAPAQMKRPRKPVFSAIESVGRAPVQCISVSHPSRLYVTDDHVMTHNTAFALNVGEHVALSLKKPVAVFSMEMGATQLAMRMIGSVGRLPAQHLRTGRLQPEDWEKLSSALGRLNDAQILIDETPALSAIEVRSRARRIAKQYKGLGLIIVDYLQLMQATTTGENRATEISEISRSMKALAKELQVPVMALSQLNRSLEQRPNKRPVMSDLRESGAIEQDADVIFFIYRDEVYNPDTQDKGIAEIIIGKQRNGPIGTVRLTFLGEYTRFESLAQPGAY